MSKGVGLTVVSLGGFVVASFIGVGFIGALGWMMFHHSIVKMFYVGNGSYELSFPAHLDNISNNGRLRDKCIERIEASSEVAYAFWGTPGIFSIGGDSYIYIAFKMGKKHKTREQWQKIIDNMFEHRRNQYRPKIGKE